MGVLSKIFMSGRSQALRIPARFRFTTLEVRIEKIGEDLWIHPEAAPASDMGAWLQHFYDTTEPLPDAFLADGRDPPPQERDWS